MTVAAFVTVQTAEDAAAAVRLIAGRSWVTHLADRLARAACVSVVVVVSRPEWRELMRTSVGSTCPVVVTADDPLHVAAYWPGRHDAVTLCPVRQFFADPARLDRLAAQPCPPDTARLIAVLSVNAHVALTGGAYLQVLTRAGLRAVMSGADLSALPAVRWTTWPDPRELHLHDEADVEWAAAVWELMLARHPDAEVGQVEAAIARHDCGRLPGWDRIGPRPSVLTVRCLREPLFSSLVAHLSRAASSVDVICAASAREATAQIPGVGRIITFTGQTFSLDAFALDDLSAIRERAYGLCVLPRLEPSGRGFENIEPLAQGCGARASVWLDLSGRYGLLAGTLASWDPATDGSPVADAMALVGRASEARRHFTAVLERSGATDAMSVAGA